jgi:hypothetical protein
MAGGSREHLAQLERDVHGEPRVRVLETVVEDLRRLLVPMPKVCGA